jgi:hypothetical protein
MLIKKSKNKLSRLSELKKYYKGLTTNNQKLQFWGLIVSIAVPLLGGIAGLVSLIAQPWMDFLVDQIVATETSTATLTPSNTPSPLSVVTPTMTLSYVNTPFRSPTWTFTPIPTTIFNYGAFISGWSNVQIDEFKTSNINDWKIGKIDNSTLITNLIRDGTLKFNILSKDRAVYEYFIRDGFFASDNMALSVEALLTRQSGCGYGLIFKGDISGNYYVFSLFNGEGYEKGLRYSISQVTPGLGQKRKVLEVGKLSLALGIPNTLSVVSIGEETYFFINEQPLTKLTLNAYQNSIHGGRVGIEMLVCPGINANFEFDNFQLRYPNETEMNKKFNLPDQFKKVIFPSDKITSNNIVNESMDNIPDNPGTLDISSDKDSTFDIFQGRQLQTFKVSARFYNPPEMSWSYGFLYGHNDQTLCSANIRSDSMFLVSCLGTNYYGVIENIVIEPGTFNTLEIQVVDRQFLFKVNDQIIFYKVFNETIPEGMVSLVVGWDDERTAEYTVKIKNIMAWKEPPDPNLLNKCEPNESIKDWTNFSSECKSYLTFQPKGIILILYPTNGHTIDVDIVKFEYSTFVQQADITFRLEENKYNSFYQFEIYDEEFNYLGNSSPDKYFLVDTQPPRTTRTYYIRVYSELENRGIKGFVTDPYRIYADVLLSTKKD